MECWKVVFWRVVKLRKRKRKRSRSWGANLQLLTTRRTRKTLKFTWSFTEWRRMAPRWIVSSWAWSHHL